MHPHPAQTELYTEHSELVATFFHALFAIGTMTSAALATLSLRARYDFEPL